MKRIQRQPVINKYLFTNSRKKSISKFKGIIAPIGLIAIVFTPYVWMFWGAKLSPNPSDWGVFGDYCGVGLGVLSAYLVYITYREQRKSDLRSLFEQHYFHLFETLETMLAKHSDMCDEDFKGIVQHFKIESSTNDVPSPQICRMILRYYYSSQNHEGQIDHSYERAFQFFVNIIRKIDSTELLNNSEKESHVDDLWFLIPDNIKVLFACWIVASGQTRLFNEFMYSPFECTWGHLGNELLEFVLKRACLNHDTASAKKSDHQSIDLEYHTDEHFYETLKRRNNL